MSDKSSSSSGIGVTGLLLVAFVVLKLTGYTRVATWSWWWVLSPMWIPALLVMVALLAIVVFKKKP